LIEQGLADLPVVGVGEGQGDVGVEGADFLGDGVRVEDRRALADELLFGKLVDGGSVIVDIDAEGKVALTFGPRSDKSQKSVSGSDQEAELTH
jgi:hypothetical protein